MRLYKSIDDGYVVSVGTGAGGSEVTEAEYSKILSVIRNKPQAPDGYGYRLKTDLTWEIAKMPDPEPAEEDTDATAEDYEAALVLLGVEM